MSKRRKVDVGRFSFLATLPVLRLPPVNEKGLPHLHDPNALSRGGERGDEGGEADFVHQPRARFFRSTRSEYSA